MFSMSSTVSQILGGLLLQADVFGLGWRAIFLVNVPVGAAALIAAALLVPQARGHRRPRLDPLGAVGVSASVALALVPLTLGHDEGWPAWTRVCLDLGLPGGLRPVLRAHAGLGTPADPPGR
jgi:MFS family permease